MNLPELLKLKYPNANFMTDIILADYGLGNGPEIRQWNLTYPEPTSQDLIDWQNDPVIIAAYAAEQNAITNAPIIAQLEDIDAKSIRALRTNDTVRLTELENQAITLRAQLVR